MRVARGIAGKPGSRSSGNSTRSPIVPITRKAATSDSPAPSLSICIQLELVAPRASRERIAASTLAAILGRPRRPWALTRSRAALTRLRIIPVVLPAMCAAYTSRCSEERSSASSVSGALSPHCATRRWSTRRTGRASTRPHTWPHSTASRRWTAAPVLGPAYCRTRGPGSVAWWKHARGCCNFLPREAGAKRGRVGEGPCPTATTVPPRSVRAATAPSVRRAPCRCGPASHSPQPR
jgi:hypothetical protein